MRTALALAALLLPAAAAGAPALSLRLAYAPAAGSAADRFPADDVLAAQVPVQVDALWRFGAAALGPYASWGLGIATGCDDGARCGGSVARLGLQALHALGAGAERTVVPWLGVGAGWEWASRRRERLGNEHTWTWSGPEAHAELGVEWRPRPRVALGPYVHVAAGRFSRVSLETPVESASAAVPARAIHAWLHLGVRGTLDL